MDPPGSGCLTFASRPGRVFDVREEAEKPPEGVK